MTRYLIKQLNIGCSPNNLNNCKDTTRFFSNLADKLKKMAISINERIIKANENSCKVVPGGIEFASVTLPEMKIGVKQEYIEYIIRFGPPENGIFNPEKLELIRNELGIQQNTHII